MGKLRLTAEQYAACWSERIETDQRRVAELVDEKKAAAAAALAKAAEADATAAKMLAGVAAPPPPEDTGSVVSSRVSGVEVGASRVERLELKLRKEQERLKELEKALARAQAPPGVL